MKEHPHKRRQLLRLAASLAALPAWSGWPAHAQIGGKLTRLVVGSAPGGPSDIQGRALAQALRSAGAGNVIVDNRPGAAGRIAVAPLKNQPADDAQLLLAPGWLLSLAPQTDRRPSFDAQADLQPLGGICTQEFALVVGPGSGARSLAEFIAIARRRSDGEQCASAGVGSMGHLVASMLERSAGITLVTVPYKGAAPALNDVQGGHVASYIGALGEMVRMHKEGLVRVLATSGAQRSKFLPDVPSFEEAGSPGVHALDWTAVFVGAQVPPAAAARHAALLRQSMNDPMLRSVLESLGVEPGYFDAAEVRRRLEADITTMRAHVSRFKLRATT